MLVLFPPYYPSCSGALMSHIKLFIINNLLATEADTTALRSDGFFVRVSAQFACVKHSS